MPPKQDAVRWLQTPVAERPEIGLDADYLSAFLKRHIMPVTRHEVEAAGGPSLWQSKMKRVPVEERDASTVFPGGILALVQGFNHGFAAPLIAQEDFLTFLRALPTDLYGSVADALREHYDLCRAFRLRPEELNSPPSYLDLFKDGRVGKKWHADCTFPSVLVNANEVVRTWQALMRPKWNQNNASRDVAAAWKRCRTTVDALHAAADGKGPQLLFIVICQGFAATCHRLQMVGGGMSQVAAYRMLPC